MNFQIVERVMMRVPGNVLAKIDFEVGLEFSFSASESQ
jgi:hypothetical protein